MAKIKNATRRAPHICLNVRANTWPSTLPLGRSNRIIKIHDARMAVPPLSGLKLKVETTGLVVIEGGATAETLNLYQLIPGSFDHGPVHKTTTISRTI